ncbi:MAG: hypothetical protein P4M08_04465 [Oligoflexia bacterium]|nr:hypothetical protein [Oligoflexia bacterium]
MKLRARWYIPLLFFGLGWSAPHAQAAESDFPRNDLYDRLYPTYIEYCGASQRIKSAVANELGSAGGKFGHGFIYLKGACRDENPAYPRIHSCAANDPGEHGVGISVNSDFSNANWVAVPSKDFYLHGLTGPSGSLNVSTYMNTKELAKSLGILNGVTFSEAALTANKNPNITREEYMYEESYGTDFATQNGRNLHCVKVPVQPVELEKMVSYLNARNDYYHAHGNYVWKDTNNCATNSDNALAAAGFWEPLPVDGPDLFSLGEIAIPLNSFIRWVRRTHDLPIETLTVLYRDESARKMLLQTGQLPLRPGVVNEYFGINSPNQAFSTAITEEFIALPPFYGLSYADFEALTKAPQYTQLKASLLKLQSRLLKVKANRQPLEMTLQGATRIEKESGVLWQFPEFYEAFYEWVDRTLVQVQEQLAHAN